MKIKKKKEIKPDTTQQKKKHVKKTSMRARKYIKNKIAGMSDHQAAIEAGYSKATAKNAAKNVEKHGVKELLEDLMDRKGLTDDKLIDALVDGLNNAQKVQCGVRLKDHATREKYLETALKLKDKFPAEKHELGGKNGEPIVVKIEDYSEDK